MSRRGVDAGSGDDDRIFVQLGGEHDIATVDVLADALDRAIALDGADLVIDLGEVTFIGSAPMRVIRSADETLRAASRSLTLRSPTSFALRVLEFSDLAHLVSPEPRVAGREAGGAGALGSWVEVPATAGGDVETSESSTPSEGQERQFTGRDGSWDIAPAEPGP